MKLHRIAALAAVAAAVAAAPLAAQAADVEVVVTASRVEEPAEEAAASVTVITAEDLEASGQVTLVDALERVAGVSFRSTTGQPVERRGLDGRLRRELPRARARPRRRSPRQPARHGRPQLARSARGERGARRDSARPRHGPLRRPRGRWRHQHHHEKGHGQARGHGVGPGRKLALQPGAPGRERLGGSRALCPERRAHRHPTATATVPPGAPWAEGSTSTGRWERASRPRCASATTRPTTRCPARSRSPVG